MSQITIHNDSGRLLRTEQFKMADRAEKQATRLLSKLRPGYVVLVWHAGFPTSAGVSDR